MEGGQAIPTITPDAQGVQLDTRYLLALLLGRDWERDVFDSVHALVTPPARARVEVSLVTVGEAFTKIATDQLAPRHDDRTPWARWLRVVQEGKLTVCWGDHHSHNSDLLEVARQVKARVPHVGPADCLIVACALTCSHCSTLHTTDRTLLTSPGLRRFCSSDGRSLRLAEAPTRPR